MASRDEIAALQLERLKRVAPARLRQRAHYRTAFDAAGVHPDDLQRAGRSRQISVHDQGRPARELSFGMFAVPREQILRIHASSGTPASRPWSATPATTSRPGPSWWRARSVPPAAGAAEAARRLRLRAVHRRPGRALWRRAAGLHGDPDLGRHDRTPGAAHRRLRARHHHGDALLHAGDPRRVPPAGLDPRETSLEVGIFGAEPWTNAMRAEIEQAFDMHAVDIYGLSEVIGPGVANECVETKDGLHVWEDHFYPEIVDPVTGEVLPDGEPGELVFTSLTKEAMPVIRYRTRDLTRLLPAPRAHAPHGEDHRPLRRHDDHARRQRVPDPDRGADPEGRGASRRTSRSCSRAKAASTRWRCWSKPRRPPPATKWQSLRRRARPARQGPDRHHRQDHRRRSGRRRAQPGQGAPRHRQAPQT